MGEEPEVIKHEIDQTASSLKEKVEQLEEQVLGTVKGTTEAVTGTVETVKETVAETIETVKETVQDTVQSVKRTFDLKYQTRQHPWLMVGGSMMAGFTAGKLIGPRGGPYAGSTNGHYGTASFSAPVSGAYPDSQVADAAYAPGRPPEPAPEGYPPGLLSRLLERFEPEITKVKQTAIGMVFRWLSDMAKQALPDPLAAKTDEIFNSITTKLGGEPMPRPASEAAATGQSRYC
jgi:ElaB/YqjD/DUF883 family membrane-anchored ribosome-binding protein